MARGAQHQPTGEDSEGKGERDRALPTDQVRCPEQERSRDDSPHGSLSPDQANLHRAELAPTAASS
jgi:hypothetical protein